MNNSLGDILKNTFKWNRTERLPYKVTNEQVKMNFGSPELMSCKALTISQVKI